MEFDALKRLVIKLGILLTAVITVRISAGDEFLPPETGKVIEADEYVQPPDKKIETEAREDRAGATDSAGAKGVKDDKSVEKAASGGMSSGKQDSDKSASGRVTSDKTNQTAAPENQASVSVVSGGALSLSLPPERYDYVIYSTMIEQTRQERGVTSIPETAYLPLEENDRYVYITGQDKYVYTEGNMPEGYKNESEAAEKMVTVTVPVWKMHDDGEKYSSGYSISINEKLAESVKCIFTEIYMLDIKFPVKYMAGFMYRKVGGVGLVNSRLMSAHSFGVAIDINPGDYDNDYYLGAGNDLRDKDNPYCIPDEVIEIFEKYGWYWGGNFDICADTMHFQYFGLDFLQYEHEDPFPELKKGKKNMSIAVIKNLCERLKKLGYIDKISSEYNSKVEKAVKDFQKDMGLEETGEVTYSTWEPLINLTHDMDYVF